MANGMIENMIRQQAAIVAFNDVWLLAVMFLAMLPFILVMRTAAKEGRSNDDALSVETSAVADVST